MKNSIIRLLCLVSVVFFISACEPTSQISSRVIEQNDRYIIFNQDAWSEFKGTTKSEARMHQNLASNHCAKFNKFAFKYNDFYENRGYQFWCFDKYVSTRGGANIVWSNYSENQIVKKEDPIKETPKNLPEDNKIVPAGSGTGFFVTTSGHIITNHHVIDGCNTSKVSYKGSQYNANVIAVDKVNDIAILKVNLKPDKIFPVAKEDVSLLQDVIVAGYPLGKNVSSAIKTHKGVVTSLAGAGDNYSEFQTDATINQGNSGGPVINQKGNVVGVAVALLDVSVGQNIFFAIKSSTVNTFANSNNIKFAKPNFKELSNSELGNLITKATIYLECHMTVAKIKQMIAEENNRKAFFKEYQ